MTLFSQNFQYIISGLTGGSIYAVIGICWSVVFLITQVMNFTTGEFVMLGGMLTWGFHLAGLGLPLSAILAVSCTILTALVLERLALRPVRHPSEMAYMMITIAAASVIKGIVLLTWGSETRTIQPFFKMKVIQLMGATLTPQMLCVVGLLIVVTVGLTVFFNHTVFGKALRASAISPVGAALIGIDSNLFRMFCFGMAGGLGAMTGLVTAPIIFTGYEIGELIGLKGLVAAIVGDWTMAGTVIAALALGLIEGLVAGLVSPGLKDVLSLLIMVIYLILRTISFPKKTRRRRNNRKVKGPISKKISVTAPMKTERFIQLNPYWIGILIALVLLPLLIDSSYVISVMVFVALYGVLAVSMGVLLEQAGLFSLAHPSWFGLGAYVSGILAVRGIVSPWLGIIIAAIFVALISYLLGVGLLRLEGFYLACATFALLLIVSILLGQGGEITGGHEGLMGIPALSLFGFELRESIHFYYLSWALCLFCVWFLTNFMSGRTGWAIKSFRDSEIASRSVGVNTPRLKLQVFVLTAVMASIVGGIYCFYIRFTMPEVFTLSLLIELLTMIIIGGGIRIYGPLLGCFVTIWLQELIHIYLGQILPVLTAEVDAIFFGIIIIIILIFAPGGLVGGVDQTVKFVRRFLASTRVTR